MDNEAVNEALKVNLVSAVTVKEIDFSTFTKLKRCVHELLLNTVMLRSLRHGVY